MTDWYNIENHYALPMTRKEEGKPFDGRCVQCGERECYAGEYMANGETYCEPCYEEMPTCEECHKKIAHDDPDPVHIEEDDEHEEQDYHADCLIEFARVWRKAAEEKIPQLNDFLRAIAKGKEVA